MERPGQTGQTVPAVAVECIIAGDQEARIEILVNKDHDNTSSFDKGVQMNYLETANVRLIDVEVLGQEQP